MNRCWPMTVKLTLLIGLTLVAALQAPGANLPAAPGYLITDLGSLGGGQTVPTAINARGDVVGSSVTASGQIHAFFLPAGGEMTDLGALGGDASYATGLNNRGDVVGYSTTGGSNPRPFVRMDGQVVDLGALGTVAGRAIAINDLRQVLIVQEAGGGSATSLLWQNGQTLPLGNLGGSPAVGGALNNLGQVVGTATAANGKTHAFAFDSVLRRLTDLGDIGPGGSMAHINEIGQAVGTRITGQGARIAFGADLTQDTAFLADKRVPRFFDGTIAYWINNEGAMAGAAEYLDPPGADAGVWTGDVQFLNLNQALLANSGWGMLSATAINDAGVMVGKAMTPEKQPVAYILTVLGPALPVDKASGIASSLDAAITAVEMGSQAAANATIPSALATALVDLKQARSLLTPSTGDATLSGVSSGQASHLLISAGNLLTVPDHSDFLSPSDRDTALAIISAAQKGLQ